jgi:thiosulfate reductase cytochrome b subunit
VGLQQKAGNEEENHSIMNQGITRSILRWIHILFAIPILGYIYSPFEKIPNYAPVTRFVFVPIMVLSGLWMWKGHVIRRVISRRPAGRNEGSERA